MKKIIGTQMNDDLLQKLAALKEKGGYRTDSSLIRAIIEDSYNKSELDKLRDHTLGAYAPTLEEVCNEGNKPISLASHLACKEINVDKVKKIASDLANLKDQLNGLLWAISEVQDNQNILIALNKSGSATPRIKQQEAQLSSDIDILHKYVVETKKAVKSLKDGRVD